MPVPAEFSLIARHFRPLAGPGALELRDDAALLMPPPGRELVLTADAMVGGVQGLPNFALCKCRSQSRNGLAHYPRQARSI